MAPAGAAARTLKRAVPASAGSSSPIAALRSGVRAVKSSEAGDATASMAVKTDPARIAVTRASASLAARPVAAGPAGSRTYIENIRRLASYDGRCRRRPRAPLVSGPNPPCASCAARPTTRRVAPSRSHISRLADGRSRRVARAPAGRHRYASTARDSRSRPSLRHSLSALSHSRPSTGTAQSVQASSARGEYGCAATPKPPSLATSSATASASPPSG